MLVYFSSRVGHSIGVCITSLKRAKHNEGERKRVRAFNGRFSLACEWKRYSRNVLAAEYKMGGIERSERAVILLYLRERMVMIIFTYRKIGYNYSTHLHLLPPLERRRGKCYALAPSS